MDILDEKNKLCRVFDEAGSLSYERVKRRREEASKFIGRGFYHTDDRPKGDVFLVDIGRLQILGFKVFLGNKQGLMASSREEERMDFLTKIVILLKGLRVILR